MNPITRPIAGMLAVTVGAGLVTFGVGAPPERCPAVDTTTVQAAAASATAWLVDNQQPDGRWLYEYDREADVAIDDYNIVRHAGVMSSLYQAASSGIPGAFESAERGLEWALDQRVARHGWIGVTTTSTLQAGTNALLLAALAERRLHTGDAAYDDVMAGLGRFLTEQVEPSGALLAYYDLTPDAPRADTYSIYYTGEAYWALGRLHAAQPDAGWGAVADRVGNYMATVRDDVEDIWPPLADHWSGYGLAQTAAFPDRPAGTPLTEAELEFVRRQGGLIGQRVRSISQRFGPWGVAVRGTFTPRGGGYGVFGEGLAGLWRAAQLDDRLAAERAALAERTQCIVGLAIEAQADADEASGYPDPQRVEGAWFIDDITRMDDQQHALSALLLTVEIVETEADDTSHPAPSWWLWLIVIVGTLNPIRVAATSGSADRRTRLRAIAVGGAVGIGALFVIGSISGWLLDAVDAGRPAMRLATASLCLLTAGIDLAVRRAPSWAPERSNAFVPVAVPLVIRPALVFASLSVVADHSLPFHGLVLVLAYGLTLAAALPGAIVAEPNDDQRSVATGWMRRMLSAAAVVAAVLLIADAVFDI